MAGASLVLFVSGDAPVEIRCKGRGFCIGKWGDFFPYLQNLFLFVQKFLNCIPSSIKNACCDAVWCAETS